MGNGAYSLDAVLGLTWSAKVVWVALGLGVIGGFANLAIRKTAPAPAHDHERHEAKATTKARRTRRNLEETFY